MKDACSAIEEAKRRARAERVELEKRNGPSFLERHGTFNEKDLIYVLGCDAAHPDRRGGQHVAMPCCAVMVIHKPTGIAVRCMDMRSYRANRREVLKRLTALLAVAPKWDQL